MSTINELRKRVDDARTFDEAKHNEYVSFIDRRITLLEQLVFLQQFCPLDERIEATKREYPYVANKSAHVPLLTAGQQEASVLVYELSKLIPYVSSLVNALNIANEKLALFDDSAYDTGNEELLDKVSNVSANFTNISYDDLNNLQDAAIAALSAAGFWE